MTQIKAFSYWYHPANKYRSIEEAVNAWLAEHPEAKVVMINFTEDTTFFKGTLYKAYLTVETPVAITDDFRTM